MEATDPSPTPDPIDWRAVCIALFAIVVLVALVRYRQVIELLVGLSGMRYLGLIGGISITIGIVATIVACWIKLKSRKLRTGDTHSKRGHDLPD